MATQPQAQDDALMLEAAADRANDEEQPDWDGIAELLDKARAGKIAMVAAMKELAMLVPEGRDDVIERTRKLLEVYQRNPLRRR